MAGKVFQVYIEPPTLADGGVTNISWIWPGFASVSTVVGRSLDNATSAVIQTICYQSMKAKRFTVVKPQNDLTFKLLRARFQKPPMKLWCGLYALEIVVQINASDVEVHDIFENQRYGTSHLDVVHFGFKSAVMEMKLDLPPAEVRASATPRNRP